MLGKTEGRRRRGHQWMRWLDSITDAMDINFDKLPEMVKDREACRAAVHRVMTWWLNNSRTLLHFFCVEFRVSDLLLKLLWAAPGVSSDAAIYHCVLSEKSMEKKKNKQIIFIPHVLSISLVRPDNHQRSITKIKCKPFQRMLLVSYLQSQHWKILEKTV